MICKVNGCGSKVKTIKSMLCEKHYYRLRRHGSTDRIIPKKLKSGLKYKTKNNGGLIILEYVNYKNILVRFIGTGFETRTFGESILNGTVKDFLYPIVCGVGFIGEGEYKRSDNGVRTPAYSKWKDMLRRCYDKKNIQKTYKGVTVCDEWHNFQNFAKWFYANYVTGFELDKDILSGKKKIYSPQTCCFVSKETNLLAARNCLGKSYSISKGDASVNFYNISKTAKELSLDTGGLCRLVNRKIKSHKGWALNVEA